MDLSTKPNINFVNIKHPDDIKDQNTQLRIRRLAMTEVGRARKKPKKKWERNVFVLEFRNPTGEALVINRFGGGQIDPFGSYPIELDDSSRSLLANSRELFS
jgi:hypothetical protein